MIEWDRFLQCSVNVFCCVKVIIATCVVCLMYARSVLYGLIKPRVPTIVRVRVNHTSQVFQRRRIACVYHVTSLLCNSVCE